MAKQKEIREVNECVIFIHGLGRTPRSFRRMRKEIDAKGFTTINISYPSTKHCIEELLERIRPQIQNASVESFDKVHFVVHSLGGIMLRLFLSRYKLKNLGRVVMLGTPNQGSRLADSLSKSKICRAFCGPALSELGTGPESIIHKFGIVDFELGVIAGTRSLNPIFSFIVARRASYPRICRAGWPRELAQTLAECRA